MRLDGSKKRSVTNFPFNILLDFPKGKVRILSAFIKISEIIEGDNESIEINDLFVRAGLDFLCIGEKKPPPAGGKPVSEYL